MVEQVAGAVIGSVVSNALGGGSTSNTAAGAAAAADQFRPYNVTTDLGTTNVTTGAIRATLGPQAKSLLDQFQSEAALGINDTAGNLYGAMQALATTDENRARTDTRNALFRAGNLGTYAGQRKIGEVERALANARLGREMNAFQVAQNIRQSAFQNYSLLAQLPASNLVAASLNRNPAAAQVANSMISAGAAQDAYNQGMAGNISGAIGNAAGQVANSSGFSNWVNDSVSSIFGMDQGYGSGYSSSGYTTSNGAWVGV